jgi:aryl-alcohol dehydrogenase-like predicted oxidoreductase
MNYRRLGRTGLQVSCISLGTAALGLEYGIRAARDTLPPPAREAVRLIHAAADGGINFFDTAPRYGDAEEKLGLALRDHADCFVATKLDARGEGAQPDADRRRRIELSLESSLRRLQRDTLDIVQIHNAGVTDFRDAVLLDTLRSAQLRGQVRFLGASVYEPEAALAALECAAIDVIQIPCNALDRRFLAAVVPAAGAAGIGVIARSILLKGALTPKARHLPPELSGLRAAAGRVAEVTGCKWDDLPGIAMRYCLGVVGLDTLLLGIRSPAELEAALAAEARGPLPGDQMNALAAIRLADETMLNPATWSGAAAL